jgi:hypothetical protein
VASQTTESHHHRRAAKQLDTFRGYYNHQRPHRAIGRRTPATAWAARPRALPTRQGHVIDEQFRVRKDRVDTDEKLTLRRGSRLHHIDIGRRWAHTPALMLIRELNIRIITEHDGVCRIFSPHTSPLAKWQNVAG